MEIYYFLLAFLLGFAFLRFKLPPLIGFLCAGLILAEFGFEVTQKLQWIGDLGVTLLLFSIGLKINIRHLLKKYVLLTALGHIIVFTLLSTLIIGLFSFLPMLQGLPWSTKLLLAFLLSFSSSVFAIKILESRAEMSTFHAKIAIGVLVIQDIVAVGFISATSVTLDIKLLILLGALPVIRWIGIWLLSATKHGEMLTLFGFCFALVCGYSGFEWAGLKGDFGVLIVGMLLAGHKKSSELSKQLLNFKDLMLVGFFITIGLSAKLTVDILITGSILLLVLLPIKQLLFYIAANLLSIKARTNVKTTLVLASFSEFALIVGVKAIDSQLLPANWLAVLALMIALSFVVASPLNAAIDRIFEKIGPSLKKYQKTKRLPEEEIMDFSKYDTLILGMGRIGKGAYDELVQLGMKNVAGVDSQHERVKNLNEKGRVVVLADVTDPDFWHRINHATVDRVLLAMPKFEQNLFALEQLTHCGFKGDVSAIAYHKDQQMELSELGAKSTFNFYAEAGAGFAEHVVQQNHKT